MNKVADTLLVSVDFTNGVDTGVLIVGRKQPNDAVMIINAFQGEEALNLYKKLIIKEKKG